jgi:serine phosphatase RsbU (regulator of sigma subunit)
MEGVFEAGDVIPAAVVERLAETVATVADTGTLDVGLGALMDAARRELACDVALARVLDPSTGDLVARAVSSASASLAAELEGSRVAVEEVEPAVVTDPARLSKAVARAARTASAEGALQIPVYVGGATVGSVEFLRARTPFSSAERQLALLTGSHVALVLAAARTAEASNGASANGPLELAGDALAAVAESSRVAQTVVRLAAEATGAERATLWRLRDGELERAAVYSAAGAQDVPETVAAQAAGALAVHRPFDIEQDSRGTLLALRLGEPPVGVLQLGFVSGSGPTAGDLARLSTFAARVASALRAIEEADRVATDLERSRALLSVLAEAIAHLSLAHTLETAVDRLARLLSCERVAVYLLESRGLQLAAGRALEGDHMRVAERLLELALGPFRARGVVVIEDAARELRLSAPRAADGEESIESAVGVPLLVHEDVIGLVAAYLPRGRVLAPSETGLLTALAVQLGVAVQNARLHEQAKTLGDELEQALSAERKTARQFRALSDISGSFAESLDFDTTLRALARTAVEALEVDAALVRVPDERRELLVARAFEAADERIADALSTALSQPAPLAAALSLWPAGERPGPLALDAARVAALGPGYDVLVAFLERGATAALVPIMSMDELLATLKLVSIDETRPISSEALETALPLAAQAALALDKARLSQQQRQFFDTMQRSLLPESVPDTPQLEIGHRYESSARLDIGGDVYDLMRLPDGRLAAVIGDVTGHGIDAAADMAMVKFLFRSLAREHSRPGNFLARANEVVVGEIAAGKFVTMAYVIIDPDRGIVACAAAGHPSPRLVRPDGTVSPLPAGGLALGVESDQEYDDIEEAFPPGAAIVLYTDGVLEARCGGEVYGEERLDALLARRASLPADELAGAILAECGDYAGGELDDDAAVVVIKRRGA